MREQIEEEIWRSVEGYEGLYQVSNLGINQGNINNVLKGRHKTAGGYIFQYKEQT